MAQGLEALHSQPTGLPDIWRDPSLLEPPLAFVTMKELHSGTNGSLIIMIEDAHANYSGQQNLAGGLDALMKKYGISLVMVEGGSGDCSMTPIKEIAPAEVWKQAAKSHLVRGGISGEEYLNLVSDRPMKIMGMEDLSLYLTSVQKYARLTKKREEHLKVLTDIRDALSKLKKKTYPEELVIYEANGLSDSEKTGAGFERRLRRLYEAALRKDVDLSEFIELTKLNTLQNSEKKVDFDMASLEQEALMEELLQKDSSEQMKERLESVRGPKNSRIPQYAYFQNTLNIAKEKGVNVEKYPQWLAYGAYLKTFSDVDLDGVLDEFPKAEDKLYIAILDSKDARLLRAIDRYTALLESAYRIRMTTQEFQMFEENEPDFGTIPYQAFLNRKLAEHGYFQDLMTYEQSFEDSKKFLSEFYASVSERDTAFAENAQKFMQAEGQKAAVMIAGGYHTANLKRLLSNKGFSIVVLTPIVTSETNQARYEEKLLGAILPPVKKVSVVSGKSGKASTASVLGKDLESLMKKKDGVREPEMVVLSTAPAALREPLTAERSSYFINGLTRLAAFIADVGEYRGASKAKADGWKARLTGLVAEFRATKTLAPTADEIALTAVEAPASLPVSTVDAGARMAATATSRTYLLARARSLESDLEIVNSMPMQDPSEFMNNSTAQVRDYRDGKVFAETLFGQMPWLKSIPSATETDVRMAVAAVYLGKRAEPNLKRSIQSNQGKLSNGSLNIFSLLDGTAGARMAETRLSADELDALHVTDAVALKSAGQWLAGEFERFGYKNQSAPRTAAGVEVLDGLSRKNLPYPDAPVVAIFPNNTDLDLASYLTSAGKMRDINFIIVPPVGSLHEGANNPKILFASTGIFYDRNGKLVSGKFAEPIRISGLIPGAARSTETVKEIEGMGIPTFNASDSLELLNDKIQFSEVLKQGGIAVPVEIRIDAPVSREAVVSTLADFMSRNSLEEIVVKPHDLGQGTGVKMFKSSRMSEAVEHIQSLIDAGHRAVIQERISNSLWSDSVTSQRVDWNLRVITTWKNERVIIDQDLTTVRSKAGNFMDISGPVSGPAGAKASTLTQFFKAANISSEDQAAFLERMRNTVEASARHLERSLFEKTGRSSKHTGLIGWDLMMKENGQFVVIEAQAGPVGGIATLEQNFNDASKGNAIMPAASHMASEAQKYYSNFPGFYDGASLGRELSKPEDAYILYNFAHALRQSGQYAESEPFSRAAAQLDDQPLFYRDLVDTLLKQNKTAEAQKIAEQWRAKQGARMAATATSRTYLLARARSLESDLEIVNSMPMQDPSEFMNNSTAQVRDYRDGKVFAETLFGQMPWLKSIPSATETDVRMAVAAVYLGKRAEPNLKRSIQSNQGKLSNGSLNIFSLLDGTAGARFASATPDNIGEALLAGKEDSWVLRRAVSRQEFTAQAKAAFEVLISDKVGLTPDQAQDVLAEELRNRQESPSFPGMSSRYIFDTLASAYQAAAAIEKANPWVKELPRYFASMFLDRTAQAFVRYRESQDGITSATAQDFISRTITLHQEDAQASGFRYLLFNVLDNIHPAGARLASTTTSEREQANRMAQEAFTLAGLTRDLLAQAHTALAAWGNPRAAGLGFIEAARPLPTFRMLSEGNVGLSIYKTSGGQYRLFQHHADLSVNFLDNGMMQVQGAASIQSPTDFASGTVQLLKEIIQKPPTPEDRDKGWLPKSKAEQVTQAVAELVRLTPPVTNEDRRDLRADFDPILVDKALQGLSIMQLERVYEAYSILPVEYGKIKGQIWAARSKPATVDLGVRGARLDEGIVPKGSLAIQLAAPEYRAVRSRPDVSDIPLLQAIGKSVGSRLEGSIAFRLQTTLGPGNALLQYRIVKAENQPTRMFADIYSADKDSHSGKIVNNLVTSLEVTDPTILSQVEAMPASMKAPEAPTEDEIPTFLVTGEPILMAFSKTNVGPAVNEFNGATRAAFGLVTDVEAVKTMPIDTSFQLLKVQSIDSILGKNPSPDRISFVLADLEKTKTKVGNKLGPEAYLLVSADPAIQEKLNALNDDLTGLDLDNVRIQMAVDSRTVTDRPDQVRNDLVAMLKKTNNSNMQELASRVQSSQKGFGIHVFDSPDQRASNEELFLSMAAFEVSGTVVARLNKDVTAMPDMMKSFLMTVMKLQDSGMLRQLHQLIDFNAAYKDYALFSVKAIRIDVSAVLQFTHMALKAIGGSA